MEHIGFIIKQISDKMRCNADADLKKHNLTLSGVRVIKFIKNNGGSVCQKEIGEHLGVSHPTVVGIVSRMCKSGYLTACSNSNDKRSKKINLTEKAYIIEKQLISNIEENEKAIVKGLSFEEEQKLKELLKRVYNNIRGEN